MFWSFAGRKSLVILFLFLAFDFCRFCAWSFGHWKHLLLKIISILPPPRKPSGRVLALSAGGSGFNPKTRTASYQRRYKNGTSSSLVQHSTLKSKILALSQELRLDIKKKEWIASGMEILRSWKTLALVAGMKTQKMQNNITDFQISTLPAPKLRGMFVSWL